MLGRAGEDVRRQDVDRRLVGVEGGFVGVGDLGRRLVLESGGDEHRVGATIESLVAQVADVGDVLDVQDVDAVVEQDAADEVGQEVAAQVADVGVAVDGRSAGVHSDPSRLEWLDGLDPAGERIAQADRHLVVNARRLSRAPLTFGTATRYLTRGLAVRFHRSPGGVDSEASSHARGIRSAGARRGLPADPPYTPGDAPSHRPRRGRNAVRCLRGFDRGRARSARPIPVRRADDARSSRPG